MTTNFNNRLSIDNFDFVIERRMYAQNEKLIPVYIEDEMKNSYITYAMSVIVGRALPDVRDGLKPVHRRILYTMREIGLEHNKPYKKSARVVGTCLAQYHPHGDMAVYDSLVRMVQDFSLRYPLVDGQGNFGCFTKDTKVKLTDGRNVSFEELIEEEKKKKKNYTYTFNHQTGRIEIAQIKKPRLTKKNRELVRVILDNGHEIRCTLNHKFMLRNGDYKEAHCLKPGDSLMPVYMRQSTFNEDPNMVGYEMIYQPEKNEWEYVHRISDERHRKDFEYVQKLAKGREKYWGQKGTRKKYSQLFTDLNRTNWKNPEYRRKMIQAVKLKWEDCKYKKRMAELSSDRMKRLWKKPGYSEWRGRLKSEELKAKWKDPEHRGRISLLNKFFHGNVGEVYMALGHKPLKAVLNHKVVKVERLSQREDVYDLTIDETHNFALASGVFVHNSVDGDAPAAMRYTEVRMSAITDEMLADIDKDTVGFMPNFDESLEEPTVLPSRLPNLLVNGSSGIAVGMATNIPPHNLSEIVDAILKIISEPEVSIKDLMKIVKGPDFPTCGIICGREGIKEAYEKGRGLLKLHAKAAIETQKGGKESIIITEIPYQVNKSKLIETIASLVQEKKIEGISDIRDESDKEGMRIVIELKRDQNAQIILNQLYKHTQMETTFGVIMLALVDNRPKVLSLKEVLELYIKHRQEIVRRRTQFELDKAEKRAHILEGLKIAIEHLNKIIKTIRESKDPKVAKTALMENFGLSEKQAQAILEMQLQRLTALERDKIEDEYLDLIKKIELYKSILKSEKKILEIVRDEAVEVKKKYGDERRTEIVAKREEMEIEDLIAEEDMVITISHAGYLKRLPIGAYRRQRRGGTGVAGIEMKEEDFVEHLFIASTHEYILFFTNTGKVHWLKVYEIPQASRSARGKAIVNLLQLSSGETISSYVRVKEFKEGSFLVMATKNGLIKKTDLMAYANPRRAGIIGITVEKGDELIEVELTDGEQEILLATNQGKIIQFSESNVRDMGRGARGVRGIRLAKKDKVIAMQIATKDSTVLTVTSQGFAKRTLIEQYRKQSRGGKGVKNVSVTKKKGEAVGLKTVNDRDELMIITEKGMIVRCPVKDIRPTGRSAQGIRVIKLDSGDRVASVARVVPEEEE